jgi:hypothetical protein
MDLDNNAVLIIIGVLILVSFGFVIYTNYNEISRIKVRLNELVSELNIFTREMRGEEPEELEMDDIQTLEYNGEHAEDEEMMEFPEDEEYREDTEEYQEEAEEYYEEPQEEVEEFQETIEVPQQESGGLFGEWKSSNPPPVSYLLGKSVSFEIKEEPQHEIVELHELAEELAEVDEVPQGECQFVLVGGKNKGGNCGKKTVKKTEFCTIHLKKTGGPVRQVYFPVGVEQEGTVLAESDDL